MKSFSSESASTLYDDVQSEISRSKVQNKELQERFQVLFEMFDYFFRITGMPESVFPLQWSFMTPKMWILSSTNPLKTFTKNCLIQEKPQAPAANQASKVSQEEMLLKLLLGLRKRLLLLHLNLSKSMMM